MADPSDKKSTHRRLAIGAAAAGAVAIAVPVTMVLAEEPEPTKTGAKATCEVEALPDSGSGGEATAISPSGKYIVGSSGGEAVRWTSGELAPIEGTGGGEELDVAAVNDSGVTVGSTIASEEGDGVAWAFRDGELSTLTAPIEETGRIDPTDVNSDGVIVGNAGPGPDTGGPDTPLRWDAGAEEASVLEVPDGKHPYVTDVFDDGTAFGTVADEAGEAGVPWLWQADGSGQAMAPAPGSDAEAAEFSGDWVLLYTGNRDVGQKATYYRWNRAESGDVEKLKLPDVGHIDADGRVFGTTDGQQPALQDGDTIIEMPKLEENPDARQDHYLWGVDDAGETVVGLALTSEGHKAVSWTCT